MLQEDYKRPTISYGTGDTYHRLTAYGTGPIFLIVRQKLYTPVAMLRSFLPFHKCISDFIFRMTVTGDSVEHRFLGNQGLLFFHHKGTSVLGPRCLA